MRAATATRCLLLAALCLIGTVAAQPAYSPTYPSSPSAYPPTYSPPAYPPTYSPPAISTCATCVKSLLVVGDSFSDVGLPYGLWSYDNSTYPYSDFGYFDGRFADGEVWVEYIEAAFNLSTMVNFAVGGSTINDVPGALPLAEQLADAADYLENFTLAEPSLGIVSMGGDDFTDLLNMTIVTNSTAVAEYADNIINGTIEAAKQLVDLGLNNVAIVPSFVNLVSSPRFLALNATNSSLAGQLARVITNMTRQLNNATRTLNRTANNATVIYIDITPEIDRIVANPRKYVLKNATDACLQFNPNGTGYAIASNGTMVPAELTYKCPNPTEYFFWDESHYTQVGHRLLSKFVATTLRKYKLLATTTL